MWISKSRYEELLKKVTDLELAAARAHGRADAAERSLDTARHEFFLATTRAHEADKRAEIAQNNFEWARVGLNRVEQERSMLLSHLLKFPVGAIEIARQTPRELEGEGMPNLPNRSPYDDMGDEEAAALGITHDSDGRVIYGKQ